ncbi:TonB-dependent receptor [Massilia endophytica]|uniref:TonB-dependent receptor n=1 Tax=Massilia endophytica TaxID=2899220 RepID=UPI001E33392E|nr:TonB-dependent receptor [Massilia endophytica]UGQ46518.1 TonB-dependent receptor [Massilia endophytica]
MRNRKKGVAVQPNTKQRLISLAVASACAAIVPAHAQTTGAAPDEEPQKIIVTGLRAAMQSTLNLKRNADGFVDGIVAEDIGKFPDTNLAESLQRISGVSIDRNLGEGARVTVRGVGPDLNMVLLNGRQMPTSALDNLNGRSFDFANLASEAVSQIQVYKSSRADTPPGGIGATINIMSARPFDRPGRQASVGVKAVYDESNNRLPGENKVGKSLTPEVSGLYSETFGMFGVAISGSYQERNSGVNSALVANGWVGPYKGNESKAVERLVPGAAGIKNFPDANDIYLWPQNMNYNTRGTHRERTNGQLTLQFKPNKDLVTTLDYTYSQNKIHSKYNEMSVWFNNGPSSGTWTDGPVAAPLVYTTNITDRGPTTAPEDLSTNGGDYGTKSTNGSTGLNVQWKVTPSLKLNLDGHHSTAVSKRDSPFGSNNDLATATFNRAITSLDFNNYMPVLSVTTVPGNSPHMVAGSWFQDGYQRMVIDQFQAGGKLSLLESSNLNFGLSHTKVKNRSLFKQVQQNAWGGAGDKTQDQSLWHQSRLSDYFGKLGGSSDPKLMQTYYTFNLAAMREAAIKSTGAPQDFTPTLVNPDWERRTTEKSKSLYLQMNTEWEIAGMPAHTGIGARYEKTDVLSTTLSTVPQSIDWVSQNELNLNSSGSTFVSGTGSYNHVLPSLDFDIDPRSDVKLRASYGETIGRPMYDQIIASTSLSNSLGVTGVNGTAGNPGLKPVKSKNKDLSAEWYYDKQSMVSLGLFHKSLSNYAGNRVVQGTGTVTTPIGGKYYNQAISASGGGCTATDTICVRNYIFRTFNGQPGVKAVSLTPNSLGVIEGTITGIAGDPFVPTRVTTPVNEKNANLKGAEINVQHMFGSSGFGVQANYTYVKSGLTFDNTGTTDQFALVGLSDSANLVGIYEDAKWSIRAAYNWRDKFLVTPADNGKSNPRYTDAYGQLDLSIGYNIDKNLSVQFEGINLTDETVRQYGRTESMALYAAQQGPRYMLSARYKF